MPQTDREVDRDEEYVGEEEEKKFPIWIVPLVAGPVLLIILIAVLAGERPVVGNGEEEEPFSEPKLLREAEDLYAKAGRLYFEGQGIRDQRQKDIMYGEAIKFLDKAQENLQRIEKYIEDHNLELEEDHIWAWQDLEGKISQLKIDLIRDKGMTGD